MSEVDVRIIVIDPPPGVTFRVQSGRDALIEPVASTKAKLTFAITLRVKDDGSGVPNFLGPCAQGPRDARFVYVNSGTMAGQKDTCWTRRAKVHLAGITRAMIEEVQRKPGSSLETEFYGRAGDGGPACATVPLLGGWKVV